MRALTLVVCASASLLGTCAAALADSAGYGISVGANVQVSAAHAMITHNEVQIAAHPSDPRYLIACSITGRSSDDWMDTYAYVSADGGATWASALHDPARISGDPTCGFGPDGSAYFSALSRKGWDDSGWLEFFRSPNTRAWNGLHFIETADVDRDWLVVDGSRTSKYRGRVYVYAQVPGQKLDGGTTPYGLTLWRSADNGRSFTRAPRRYLSDDNQVFWPGNCVVMADGTFVAAVTQVDANKRNDGWGGSYYGPANKKNGWIKVVTSTDGGVTLNPAVKVDDGYLDWRDQASGIPSIAADTTNGPFRNRLYVVWTDGRQGGRTQIFLSSSDDKGKTWSPAHLVNDNRAPARDGLERGDFMPSVAVNNNGVVGVSWYDRRDAANDYSYRVRFAASYDGGETFGASVHVSTAAKTFDAGEQWMPFSFVNAGAPGNAVDVTVTRDEWLAGGHTAGMAADASGVFHPLWIDNRTGIHQMWTAPVTVHGMAVRNGSPDLSSFKDVSGKIRVVVRETRYDPSTHDIALALVLQNKSKSAVAFPLFLRATNLSSEMGEVEVVGADNAVTGDGAIWRFSGSQSGATSLAAGASSEMRTLHFHLTQVTPYEHAAQFENGFPSQLHLVGKVLAR